MEGRHVSADNPHPGLGAQHCQRGFRVHEGRTQAGHRDRPSPYLCAPDLSVPSPAPLAAPRDAFCITEPICLRLAYTFLFRVGKSEAEVLSCVVAGGTRSLSVKGRRAEHREAWQVDDREAGGAEGLRTMAETITYADLRFVKAPLMKSVSSRMGKGQGQDPEADEDGELTYENVQVPPVPGVPSSLVSSGLGDNAGVKAEHPAAGWRSGTSLAARLAVSCRAPCWHYLLLCLLLICLLLGVAATCLGVHYLQASEQLQQVNRVLEATNSSLRQQLRLKITQLGQREEDLQGSRRQLAQTQEALQTEQRVHRDAEEHLQACQLDREKTNENLQGEKEQKSALEQRLNSIQDTLKRLIQCQSQGSMIESKNVPRYKDFGHGPEIQEKYRKSYVQLFFPSSVRWQLSGFQMGTTEIYTHANKSLCPSSLPVACSPKITLSLPGTSSPWAGPSQGLIHA
nr:B-cell differentiation antigen CD72 isoform X3 [Microcebus murinus]